MATALQIEILKQVYRHHLLYDKYVESDNILLYISEELKYEELKKLEFSGLIKKEKNNTYSITDAGRSKFRIVLTGGAYDLLHRGHLITLSEAKSFGDFLVVVVARDITVEKNKRSPVHSETDRAQMLNALEIVDAAILGDKVDHMRVVRRIKPDVIVLGSDQEHILSKLQEQVKDQGLPNTKVIRLTVDYEDLATTRLINQIKERKDLI